MATRKIKLQGPCNWAKVFEDNRDMRGFEGALEEFNGGYTIEVGLDTDNFKTLKDAESMKEGKEGPDGLQYVKFLRKHEDRFDWASGAPKVINAATGEPWDFEEDGAIGNGSTVEVEVTVYDTRRPSIKGTRLETVSVIEYVEPETALSEDKEKVPF